MTKRDYELVASVIKANAWLDDDAREQIATDLALRLGEKDPRFDPERFVAACGVRINERS